MTTIIVFLAVLLISVSLHEMMHALVAYRLGDDLAHSHGRISLNPFRHIDPFLTLLLPAIMLISGIPPILAAKPVPINTSRLKYDELGLAAVGLAGPLTNLFLAGIGSFAVAALGVGALRDVMTLFVQLNVGLFVFNMLPLPPLDGSRLLYAFAPEPVQRFMERIEQFGILAIIVIISITLPVLSPILISVQRAILNFLL
jgi:Zn-dependent protease